MDGQKLSFNTLGFSATITRPANTTQYAINDVMADATGNAPFVLGTGYTDTTARENPWLAPLRGNSSIDGRSVTLNSLRMVSSRSTASMMELELHLFSAQPTLSADNAAYAPTLADLQDKWMGKVDVPALEWAQYTNGNVVFLPNLDTVFTFPEPASWANTTGQIWVVPVLKNAYTPASGEVVRLTMNFSRD